MVRRVRPVILLVYVPDPEPLVVLGFEVVGFPVVFQQTPLDVTEPAQLPDIVPPELAVVAAIPDTAVVTIVGEDTPVVNEVWVLLYAVPAELVT